MNNRDETAENFLKLVRKTYAEPIKHLIIKAEGAEEEVAFHKMHGALRDRSPIKAARRLEECYPYVRVDGQWYLSIPKMHMYLMNARLALATFKDERIQACYRAVQNSQKYIEEAKALDRLLTPDVSNGGYDEYTKALSDLYKLHCMEQMALLVG